MNRPAEWDETFEIAAGARLSSALWRAILARVLIFPLAKGAKQPAALAIEAAWSAHVERSARIATVLRDIVAAMNAAGIEPVLLKGAQAIWSGAPDWRHVRDIDLLLAAREADAAQAILLGLNFAPLKGRAERPGRHHLTPLFRADFPAWIEVHRRAANGYAERLIGTSEMMRSARLDQRGGMRARVVAPELAVLYALVHHHVGHGGDARGTLDLKGLYEFAVAAEALSEAERVSLVARADRHPRLAAMLDLWTAAATDIFGMPVHPPLRLESDAAERWRRVLGRRAGKAVRARSEGKYPGYRDELEMAMAMHRLRRAPGGRTSLGRLTLRTQIVGSLLPPLLRRPG